jgi:hypothetical protein
MFIALSAVVSVFYLGIQLEKIAETGKKSVVELQQTKNILCELILYPEKNRHVVRNVEDWVRRAQR